MSDLAFQPGIVCAECGTYTEGDYHLGIDHRREYDGRDVCVSCLIDMCLENSGYS